MPAAEKEQKTVTINQNTLMSIGLVVTILSAVVWVVVNITTFQARMSTIESLQKDLRSDISEVKLNYVNRNELMLRFDNFDGRLKNIEDLLKRK